VCWLDSADWTSVDLEHNWDIVTCTHGFVRRQYIIAKPFECQATIATLLGAERLAQDVHRRSFSPLPFKFHTNRQPISVLIVDEAQAAKNMESQLHEGLRSLSYCTAFMLTGTPLYNRWPDILGLLRLLSGSPFRDRHHFQAMFTLPDLHNGIDSAELGKHHARLFTRPPRRHGRRQAQVDSEATHPPFQRGDRGYVRNITEVLVIERPVILVRWMLDNAKITSGAKTLAYKLAAFELSAEAGLMRQTAFFGHTELELRVSLWISVVARPT
jgi:hypothetical protein